MTRMGTRRASAIVQPFDKVFGRFFVTLFFIESVRVGPPGVTMHFDPVAVPFAGEPGDISFELPADPVTARRIIYDEIADAGKVAFYGDLGDEVKRKESDDYGV